MGIKRRPIPRPRTVFERDLQELRADRNRMWGGRYITADDLEYNRERLRRARELNNNFFYRFFMIVAAPFVRIGRLFGP